MNTDKDTPKDVLIRIKARFADPRRWTQDAMARDVTGRMVYESSNEAACWCLSGAILVETLPDEHALRASVRREIFKYIGTNDIAAFNDESSYDEVMRVLQSAVNSASTEVV